jgi:hypothetical protein
MIYAVVDCIQTDRSEVRNLAKPMWLLLILLFWVVGPIAWLVAGRPERGNRGGSASWPSPGASGFPEHEPPPRLAPDDDPEFLSQLGRSNNEHEQMLKKWEEDLRHREEQLRENERDRPDSDDR